jgi:serine/threonine-protein kinase
MGEVYLATAAGIEGAERPLIVKIIRRDHADDRSFKARFLDEARIQSQLQHPGVAQILEATTDKEGAPYVVVEHVEGRNLSEARARAAQLGLRIGWPEAMAIGVCLGEALTHVHERTCPDGRPLEIVHRDLSPQNVMIGYGGELKLIDFGTARGQNRRCQTISGIVFAKPGYVAPEVANNTPGGVPADLYAFGVVLWELVAGRRFLSGEAAEHMAAVGAGKRTLPPLSQLTGCPVELDQVIARLTAVRIEDRYPSARAATQDVVKVLQRAPSLADGDRSVRGRISDLMRRLYPAEPARSRADFARRVAEARSAQARPAVLAVPASPEPPASNDAELLLGTRYRLGRQIGRGAMGVVYEAVHEDLGRSVALKVLDADAMNEKARRRFRLEACAIAQIEHENLVAIYDYGVCADGRPFYAMEMLEGESLDVRLAREGLLPVNVAVDYAIRACRGLAAAHRAGVIHRDVKPANLFVTVGGELKVLDFGVAKTASPPNFSESVESVELIGTPEYMPPEQARAEADARSDVYALASTIYELITGSLPFPAESMVVMLADKAKLRPERPSLRAPDAAIPPQLDKLLLSAMDPDPSRRPASIDTFALELERVLARTNGRALRRKRFGRATISAMLAASLAVLAVAGSRSVDTLRTEFPSLGAALAPFSNRGISGVTRVAATQIERAFSHLSMRGTPPGAHPEAVAKAAPASPVNAGAVAVAKEVEATAPSERLAKAFADEKSPAEAAAATPADTAQVVPSSVAVHPALAKADALEHEGRALRALEVLREAALDEAAPADVLARLTRALMKTGAWGEALRVARRRHELDASADAQLELARVERAMGNHDRALALVRNVLERPDAPREAKALLRAMVPGERVALRD